MGFDGALHAVWFTGEGPQHDGGSLTRAYAANQSEKPVMSAPLAEGKGRLGRARAAFRFPSCATIATDVGGPLVSHHRQQGTNPCGLALGAGHSEFSLRLPRDNDVSAASRP